MIVTFHKYGYILPRTGAVVHWWWEDTPGGLLCRKDAIDIYMVSYPGDGDAFPTVHFCGMIYPCWNRQRLEEVIKKRASGTSWGHLVNADGPVSMDALVEEYLDDIPRMQEVIEYMDSSIRQDLILAHGYNRPAAIIMSYLGMYGNLEID